MHPVRNSATLVDCYYEDLVFDMYIAEAGLRAEEEGYDAVIMDTVSDSGLYALRSRLTIRRPFASVCACTRD